MIIIIIIIIMIIIITRVPSCKLHDREIVHALTNQRRLRPFGDCSSRLGHLVEPNMTSLRASEFRATAECFPRGFSFSCFLVFSSSRFLVFSFSRFFVFSFSGFLVFSFSRFLVFSFSRFLVFSFSRFLVFLFSRFLVLSFSCSQHDSDQA